MQIVRVNCFGAYENFFFVIFLSKLSYDVITRLLFKVIFDLNSIFPLFFFHFHLLLHAIRNSKSGTRYLHTKIKFQSLFIYLTWFQYHKVEEQEVMT